MTIEQLFVNTLVDLENRINSSDPYEILGASALLRKLFLDDFPLVDQVNRKYKLKISFVIGLNLDYQDDIPKPIFTSIQDAFDPDSVSPVYPRKTVNRDQLFKAVLSTINGQEYSLKDIVLFEANVMGGVHAGTPKSEKENVLKLIGDTLSIGGYSSSLRQLKAVGKVVLKGLKDLRQAVEESI